MQVIQDLRKKMTLQEIATFFGVTPATVMRWETKTPNKRNMRKIEERLSEIKNKSENDIFDEIEKVIRAVFFVTTEEEINEIVSFSKKEKEKISEIKKRKQK